MSHFEPPVVLAITGKPLEHYEKYVDLVAKVMANALALAADRDFLMSLDQSMPIEEAVKVQARESIRWRWATHIDEIEAQIGEAS